MWLEGRSPGTQGSENQTAGFPNGPGRKNLSEMPEHRRREKRSPPTEQPTVSPTDEEIARDYELWVKYVHDEIPDGEFYAMTVREKLEIIAAIRPKKESQ